MTNDRSSLIRSEMPYALVGTIIGVIAGGTLFLHTQKIDWPAIPAVMTAEPASASAPPAGPHFHLERR